jgi:hypothetical protein
MPRGPREPARLRGPAVRRLRSYVLLSRRAAVMPSTSVTWQRRATGSCERSPTACCAPRRRWRSWAAARGSARAACADGRSSSRPVPTCAWRICTERRLTSAAPAWRGLRRRRPRGPRGCSGSDGRATSSSRATRWRRRPDRAPSCSRPELTTPARSSWRGESATRRLPVHCRPSERWRARTAPRAIHVRRVRPHPRANA